MTIPAELVRAARAANRRQPISPRLFAQARAMGMMPQYSAPDERRISDFAEAHRFGDARAIVRLSNAMVVEGDAYGLAVAIDVLTARGFRGARRVG